MRVNPILLGLGLLLVVAVVIGLGGNLGRGEDQKQFPPHAAQQ